MENTKRGRKNVLGEKPGKILVSLSNDDYEAFKSFCKGHNRSMADVVRECIIKKLTATE